MADRDYDEAFLIFSALARPTDTQLAAELAPDYVSYLLDEAGVPAVGPISHRQVPPPRAIVWRHR